MTDISAGSGFRTRRHVGQAVSQHKALSKDGISERLFALAFSGLVYPQIWEDPEIDMEAMQLAKGHRVVTIASGGCNMLTFTTGRGSAYGCKPTPSIKLATNSEMYHRMTDDMDINCGDVLDGVPLETKGQEIFDMVLRVASGEKSKSELLGYGDAEYVPWQIGATM